MKKSSATWLTESSTLISSRSLLLNMTKSWISYKLNLHSLKTQEQARRLRICNFYKQRKVCSSRPKQMMPKMMSLAWSLRQAATWAANSLQSHRLLGGSRTGYQRLATSPTLTIFTKSWRVRRGRDRGLRKSWKIWGGCRRRLQVTLASGRRSEMHIYISSYTT